MTWVLNTAHGRSGNTCQTSLQIQYSLVQLHSLGVPDQTAWIDRARLALANNKACNRWDCGQAKRQAQSHPGLV